jgi:hypothetical protein
MTDAKTFGLKQPLATAVYLPALGAEYYKTAYRSAVKTRSFRSGFEPRDLAFWSGSSRLWNHHHVLHSIGGHGVGSDTKDKFYHQDRDEFILLGDSGGYQIGAGTLKGLQGLKKGITAEQAQTAWAANYDAKLWIIDWLERYSDYAMTLDIPTWLVQNPEASKKTGIYTYEQAVATTHFNNEYFIQNRLGWQNGGTRFLNVLQGSSHSEADFWYEQMKKYCDPTQYPDQHFNGWAMGGQNMCDVHLVLRRIITLMYDGLLETGVHDWMHFLGTSKLEWACLLTDIQRAVRQYHNPNFTISFDCASPFLATANGQIYTNLRIEDRGKWSYQMEPTADDKRYSTDSRSFRDATTQDGIHEIFEDSPISSRLKISDVCTYQPGDLNKLGKEGRTSWDSFSYALMMGHNVWQHINAVQSANERYDAGETPYMLAGRKDAAHDFRNIVADIFGQQDRQRSLARVDHYEKTLDLIIGTRGFTGKRLYQPTFDSWFDVATHNQDGDLDETDTEQLDQLEASI